MEVPRPKIDSEAEIDISKCTAEDLRRLLVELQAIEEQKELDRMSDV